MNLNIYKLILRIISFISLLILIYVLINRDFTELKSDQFLLILKFYILPIFFIGGFSFYLSFKSKTVNLISVIILLSSLTSLFFFEIYLQNSQKNYKKKILEVSKKMNIFLDERSVQEVVEAYRKNQINAYPFFTLRNEDLKILPLGNAPISTIVHCNEMGQYMTYNTDRYGLNNNDEIWDKKLIKVFVIGDSFPHGACMPNNVGGFVDLMKKKEPDLINLSMSGNGPQLNLASLIEFIKDKNPEYILWFHYGGNDLSNMIQLKSHKILNKYIYEDFSQNLIIKTRETEELFKEFFTNKFVYPKKQDERFRAKINLQHLFKLYYLRTRLGMAIPNLDSEMFNYFKDIMSKAKNESGKLGAKLIFINIPPVERIKKPNNIIEKETLKVIKDLNIELYDLKEHMKLKNNPEKFYTYGLKGGHFNFEGNRYIAEYILEKV